MPFIFGRDNSIREEVFLNSEKWIGAFCGVLVEQSEDGSGFIEKASFGYGDDGFFYSFLARGKGYLEKLQKGDEPFLFSKEEFPLFSENGKFAVVTRLQKANQFLGFILLEFNGSEEKAKWLSHLLAYYLSPKETIQIPAKELQFVSAIEWILNNWKTTQKELENLDQTKPILIKGEIGSGKKALSRYLSKQWGRKGEWICINTIPIQVGKLEKSLLHWEEILGKEGSIVLENLGNLNLGQQRIFYEWIQNSQFARNAFFLDSGESKNEIYPAFWDLLGQNSISLPSLVKLEREGKKQLILAVFKDLILSLGKNQIQISEAIINQLLDRKNLVNLEEVKNTLVKAIWKSNSSTLTLEEDIGKENESIQIGLQDSEDLDLPKCVEALERQKILLAEKIFAGNQLRMAKALNISRGSLQYKMKNLGLIK
jgi:hypothetical protein